MSVERLDWSLFDRVLALAMAQMRVDARAGAVSTARLLRWQVEGGHGDEALVKRVFRGLKRETDPRRYRRRSDQLLQRRRRLLARMDGAAGALPDAERLAWAAVREVLRGGSGGA